MIDVTLQLPENVARSLGESHEQMARQLLENAAIEGYRTGQFSHRQVGDMLRLDYWQTENFLAEHRVPLNYTIDDLDADRSALERILGDK